MQLALIDWIIIISYFALSLGIGLFFSRRAGKNIQEYFVSGRSFPWWVAGTAMVATTFAADTPLAVTGLVAQYGLAGNWFWWSFALGGMITVFVYARLWRRSEVMTDVELIEMRYGGKPAAFLRGFRAVYIAVLVNSIIIGWVTGAMMKVLKFTVLADTAAANSGNDWVLIVIMLAIVGAYSTLSGIWGVSITDFIQFFIAMGGCIALAILAVKHVGGVEAMQTKLGALRGGDALSYLPSFGGNDAWMPMHLFLIYLFVMWWASWYPGAEPGGGGYVVQRMASCKDERHSLLATLWFQIAHYCVRPWPWLLVAFASLIMFPELQTAGDPDVGFPMVMTELLPAGLRGLLLVAFFAAFMSTISTQINWGASYLVIDFYKRFFRPNESDRHYTWASRIATLVVLSLGGIAAYLLRNFSIGDAWKFLAALGAGTGAVFMLRWFWWRINAWTEIVAMVAALIFYAIFYVATRPETEGGDPAMTNEVILAIVAGLTILSWLAATYLTAPEKDEVLDSFFRKTRPGGPGWGPVKRRLPEVRADQNLGISIFTALVAALMVYLTIPGVGLIIFANYAHGALCLLGAAACAGLVIYLMRRIGWEQMVK